MKASSTLTVNQRQIVEHVADSILKAESFTSGLTPEVLALGGMSSPKIRHFLNNVCNRPGTRYLEVGTYAGSTLVAALYRNPLMIIAADAVDDYSQFGGWETFQTVTEQHLIPGQFTFHKRDFREVDLTKSPPPINVYFYDGAHETQDHADAITHFWPCLAGTFILIIDDWLEPQAKAGTLQGFRDFSHRVLASWELPSRGNGDVEQWWNGLYVAVIQKL